MGVINNILNQVFGRLKVIRYNAEVSKIKGRACWDCECECGNIITVTGNSLLTGNTRSCGCLHSEQLKERNFRDITGMKIDMLTALRYDFEAYEKTGRTYWICRCECGNIKSISLDYLMSSNTSCHSCGCMTIQSMSKSNSKRNEIRILEDFGYAEVWFNKDGDGFFKCDIEDLDVIRKYCWHKSLGYACTHIRDNENKIHSVRAHRVILSKYYSEEEMKDKVVDHRNHDILDNRKDNTRLCTTSENMINRRPYSNTGEKYISYLEKLDKYRFSFNKHTKSFKTKLDAINYRDEYLKQHPNEFRYNRSEDINISRNQNKIIYPFYDIITGLPIKRNIIKPFIEIDNNNIDGL